MKENSAKPEKGFEIFFGIVMFLCAVVGYKSGAYVYRYIEQWCIYTVIASCWSTFSLLGVVVLDGIILIKSLVGKAVGKIQSATSRAAKGFGLWGWRHCVLSLHGCTLRRGLRSAIQWRKVKKKKKVR